MNYELIIGFPSIEVIKAYLEPLVDQSTEPFSWQKPKLTELRNYAKEKFGWNETRIDKLLQPVFENLNRTEVMIFYSFLLNPINFFLNSR